MKAEELRIGNWIMGANKKHLKIDAGDICVIANHRADCTGISLTEELLITIDFVKISDHKDGYTNYKTSNGFVISRANFNYDKIAKNGCFYVGENYKEIKSLHQLQNYYYAITEKELEINLCENELRF